MPKLKSHRGAAKRFRRTGTGRIKARKAFRNHILTKVRTKLKRHMRGGLNVRECDVKSVNRMLQGS